MINRKNEINLEDHLKILENFNQATNTIITHFINNYKPDDQINLNEISDINIYKSTKKKLINYQNHHKEFNKILRDNKDINRIKDVEGEYKELMYEIKIVLKDTETINSSKILIENELNLLKVMIPLIKEQENLTKRSSHNQSYFSENKSYKSSQGVKYSTNLSATSTQMSNIEMKKEIDDRKKIIKHYGEKLIEMEDKLNGTKSILSDKSKISQKLLNENDEIKWRMNQNENIINQLKSEISMIKDKKNRNLSGFVHDIDLKNSINNLSNINYKEQKRKEKEKNSFLGFVKSILSKD